MSSRQPPPKASDSSPPLPPHAVNGLYAANGDNAVPDNQMIIATLDRLDQKIDGLGQKFDAALVQVGRHDERLRQIEGETQTRHSHEFVRSNNLIGWIVATIIATATVGCSLLGSVTGIILHFLK